MKRISLKLLLLCIGISCAAAPGDTIVVQAFSFGSSQDSVIVFPSDTHRFEKILMHYTLKCNPAQNPACGEWDYLTYTYIYPLNSTERFEIGRYITPYGIGLDLGSGFTWVFDVSDYRPLLVDSVRVTAGNWQELLDLKFLFIEGTPPRDVLKVENLWSGDFKLSDFDSTVLPKTVALAPAAVGFKIKTRTSGHGWDNPTNCAEFCPKYHSVNVDGVKRFEWLLWDECAYNPVYPQGGTWLIDRAGWCPGDIVRDYNFELTPFVSAGATVEIDYNAEYDVHGNYVLEAQLISYSAPNFTTDAAVDEIIAPTSADIHGRKNPICGKPVIRIKNAGSENLQKVLITFGVQGGSPCYYLWQGSLDFLETAIVELPRFNWSGFDVIHPTFYATVSFPNNKQDEYSPNNTALGYFNIPPQYPNEFYLELKTNSMAAENAWLIKNELDSIIYRSSNLSDNTIYRDTFHFQNGCYSFHLTDSGHDGLNWWFNRTTAGTGYVRFRRSVVSGVHITFEPDFGAEVYHEFTVGFDLGQDTSFYACDEIIISTDGKIAAAPLALSMNCYPNPASGTLTISCRGIQSSEVKIEIYNLYGKIVFLEKMPGPGNKILDIASFPSGIYFVVAFAGNQSTVQKVVLQSGK